MTTTDRCGFPTRRGGACNLRAVAGTDRCWLKAHKDSLDAIPKKWEARFLEEFGDRGIVTYAAAAINRDPSTIYRWIKESPRFAALFAEAEERSLGTLENELLRRGRDGVSKPVYQGKELVGYIQEYSDACLIFALKSRAPHKYRERVEVSGHLNHTVRSELDERISSLLGQFDRTDRPVVGQRAGGAGDAGRSGTLDS